MLQFFKILAVVSAVSAWATKALADGKVDAAEAAELVETICGALGIRAEITLGVSPSLPPTAPSA